MLVEDNIDKLRPQAMSVAHIDIPVLIDYHLLIYVTWLSLFFSL